MKIYKDEIQIMRGESWNFDVLLTAANGAPLIISSELKNPYFLLTVSSLKFPVEDRVVRNYWCKPWGASNVAFNRFYRTTPIAVSPSFIKEYESLDEWMTAERTVYSGEVNGGNSLSRAVFTTIENGVKYYWLFESDKNQHIVPKKYECRFTCQFPAYDTVNWIEQEYSFSMKLVDFPVVDKEIESFDSENMFHRPDSYIEVYCERPHFRRMATYSFVQEINVPKLIKVHSNISLSLLQEE